jgi:hypothetical protein
MDQEELRQEMELVLLKCLRGYDPSKKIAKFHTYLHTAMRNRIGTLRIPFNPQRNKRGVVRAPRRVDPNRITYLSQVAGGEESGSTLEERVPIEELTVGFSTTLEFHMEDMGFDQTERLWLRGRVERLSIGETARVFQVPEELVRAGYASATKKIRRIRRDATSCHRPDEG